MKRVLVAEDSREIRDLIYLALQMRGFVVLAVRDGKYAVEAAPDNTFQLFIFDVQMPNMSGIEAAEKIRQLPQYAETPFLFLSGNPIPNELAQRPNVYHLVKPFSIIQLMEKADAIIEPTTATDSA